MTNHVHLLLTPKGRSNVSTLMKMLGQRYVQYINRVYRRSGSLWEGRFRSSLIDADAYLLACHRYIELNPVRAGMAVHPAEYRWSSYRANAQGELSPVVTPHALYQALSPDLASRLSAYRDLFRAELDPDLADQIRTAASGGFVLGNERFQKEVAEALKRRVTPGKPGRRRKVVDTVAQTTLEFT